MTLGEWLGSYAGGWFGRSSEVDPNALRGVARGTSTASATLTGTSESVPVNIAGSAAGTSGADATLRPKRAGGGGYTSFFGAPPAIARNMVGRAAGSSSAVATVSAVGNLEGVADGVATVGGRVVGVWYPAAAAEDELWLLAA